MIETTVTAKENYKIVALKGRLDSMSSQRIQQELTQLTVAGDRVLVVDFKEVNYISSAGLRVFLILQKQLTTAGGDLIIFSVSEYIMEIFRSGGFHNILKFAGSEAELHKMLGSSDGKQETLTKEINGIKFSYQENTAAKGELFTFGNPEKTAKAEFTEDDVVAREPSKMSFGCGLAAFGDNYDDYKDYFGEAVILQNSLLFYPAVKQAAVDYILYNGNDSMGNYKFLHGFGFKGDFTKVVTFEGNDSFVELITLVNAISEISSSKQFGIVFIAESKGIWGMNLKKVPVSDNAPQAGGSVFDSAHLADWVNFPLEPADVNTLVVGCGVAVKNTEDCSAELKRHLTGDNNFHIHAAIYEEELVNKNPDTFGEELKRIVSESQVLKVQHLMARTKFSYGIAAIIEL